MATLFGGTVWEGVSTQPFPTYEEGARDGHFMKHLDTGESYIRVLASWKYINLGLAFVKATKSGAITTDANGEGEVVFVTPFINAEYRVVFGVLDTEGKTPIASSYNRLATGFKVRTRDTTSGQLTGNVEISWLATRDYNP